MEDGDGEIRSLEDESRRVEGGEGGGLEAAYRRKVSKNNPFERLGLWPEIAHSVQRLGYKLPTPIQRKAIPIILSGRDVVAMARTGSGKTAAFLLPLIQRLTKHSARVGARAVVLEPTRELAFQVLAVFKQVVRKASANLSSLRTCAIVGGAGMESQFERLANNPDVIVASPGRLVHHCVETDSKLLSAVEILVVDEADQLFEQGMQDQIGRLLEGVNLNRQCVMVSATLPSALVEFSRVGLRDPAFIRLDTDQSLSENLELIFLYTRTEEKLPSLVHLLKHKLSTKKVLIFVSSRHQVELLDCVFTHLHDSTLKFGVSYGSMDQEARNENLTRFRRGEYNILLVTDVAARGLDISEVDVVLNYDFPTSPKHFIHRVGRTARAGKSGIAISLLTITDLSYAMEVLLFCGLTLSLGSMHDFVGTSCSWPTLKSREAVMGGLPDLSEEVELLSALMHRNVELQQKVKTAKLAMGQYCKMRRQPSRQSIKRTKELKDCGGVSQLLCNIHPWFLAGEATMSPKEEVAASLHGRKATFLEKLRSTKPRCTSIAVKGSGGRHAGVLPPDVVNRMSALQRYRQRLRAMSEGLEKQQTLGGPTDGVPLLNDDLNSDSGSDDVFDWKSFARAGDKAHRYFLDVEQTPESERRSLQDRHLRVSQKRGGGGEEEGLRAMREAQLDIIPDNDREQRIVKHVRKWNAIRKKYVMTPVDPASGKVLRTKELRRRNEAGTLVRGELQRTGIYEKWVGHSKQRIQRVGEIESANLPSSKRSRNTTVHDSAPSRKGPECNESPATSVGKPPLTSLTKDPELIHALKKGLALTHKQKRKVKKLERLRDGNVVHGVGRDLRRTESARAQRGEIKNAREMLRVKKVLEKKAARHNPRLREQMSRAGRAKHMKKRELQNKARAAKPRSFAIPKGKRARHKS